MALSREVPSRMLEESDYFTPVLVYGHINGAFESAQKCKEEQYWSGYMIHLTEAANLGHAKARAEIEADRNGAQLHLLQDLEVTMPYYLQTDNMPYSAAYLGYLREAKKDEILTA